MVESMYERSPGFFKQFQKNFKYFILEEIPNFSCLKNFAFCMHFESVHCDYNPAIHYHANKTVLSSVSFYNFQVSVLVFGYTEGKGRCFTKTPAGSGVQQKQFQRILKSRHYCFHKKAFANVHEKCHKQISTT